ncbi:MAG: STAS domain-containing protein, partial [Nitrososphaerales archaeon]
VIDCSALTFIDCSGLGMFVGIHQLCAAQGVKLVLVNPSPLTQKLLGITHLDDVLNVQIDGVGS